ncbi:M23 family metallopeptidase [Tunturiibacter gelidoferens]|uniref:M23 family metallopeptidase n=1 Tax=Tunturiibacter gelidiferens TaxID=3069689 RepID=A0AAU7Z420_9BACT
MDSLIMQKMSPMQTGMETTPPPAYGTSVYAMEAGTVTKLDGSEGPASPAFPACQGLRKLANTVWIQGSDTYITRYVHVTPAPGLTLGQKVTQGQVIGTLDNSGCQQGAHLHLGRYPVNGPAVNFSIPCVNAPTNQLWDGTVDDDDSAITP